MVVRQLKSLRTPVPHNASVMQVNKNKIDSQCLFLKTNDLRNFYYVQWKTFMCDGTVALLRIHSLQYGT
jgi:hypothetical protein